MAAAPRAAPGWRARSARKRLGVRWQPWLRRHRARSLSERKAELGEVGDQRRGLRLVERDERRANRGPVRVVVEMRNDAFQRRDHRIGLQRLAQSRDLGLQALRLWSAPVFVDFANPRDVDVARGGDAAGATLAQRV